MSVYDDWVEQYKIAKAKIEEFGTTIVVPNRQLVGDVDRIKLKLQKVSTEDADGD